MSMDKLGLKWVPKGEKNPFAFGRIVDLRRTREGMELAGDQIKNITTFMLVDVVGEGVDRCAPGDVVCYHKCFHLYLRGGAHTAVVANEEIMCVVEGVDFELFDVEGQRVRRNGTPPRIVTP